MADDDNSSEPPPRQERSWVWHASLNSRDAGKVSVLACVETLFAVGLYWLIAIKWDTHWHLLSSVFVAPLLLLRSPESIRLGVNFFVADWFGFEQYFSWSQRRRSIWLGIIALVALFLSAWIRKSLFPVWFGGNLWLVGFHGMVVATLCSTTLTVGLLILVVWGVLCPKSGKNRSAQEDQQRRARLAGMLADTKLSSVLMCVAGAALLGSIMNYTSLFWLVGIVALFVVLTCTFKTPSSLWRVLRRRFFLGYNKGVNRRAPSRHPFNSTMAAWLFSGFVYPFAAFGTVIRALITRSAATVLKLPLGVSLLASNWRENNFIIDSYLPAELIPGIRERNTRYAVDGFIASLRGNPDVVIKWTYGTLTGLIFFVPALLYRINIKATAWFWWPLAYLLKPIPKADKSSQQKQSLCWPWDNRMQNLLILLPAVVVVGILIYDHFDPGRLSELRNAAAIPIPLKLILGMEWNYIPAWHWALLIVEVTGLGMLWIAGNASSHKKNGNWQSYAQAGMKRDLLLMEGLTRIRSLAAKAFMLLGLGMCLISFPEWRKQLPAPILQRLENFYHTQELREQERLLHRASEEHKLSSESTPKR